MERKHTHVIRTPDQRRRPTACLSMVPLCRRKPVRKSQNPGREGGVGEDHRVPPSHPYCACARPLLAAYFTPGRGDVGAPEKGYTRGPGAAPPLRTSISGVQEGPKGWALRSLQVSEPDLKVTGWRSGGRRGCFGIPRTSLSSGAPESLFPP